MVKHTTGRPRLVVTADGKGPVNHAGARLLCDLADGLGLTAELGRVMDRTVRRRVVHDRGRMLVDVAVMLADGGTCLSDLAALRVQPELFGEVASTPTAWRVIQQIDAEVVAAVDQARAGARRRAWEAGADPGFYVLDIDGTLVGSHSEDKDGAAPNYKHGFGFYPIVCFLDGSGEALAGMLRPGNAGSTTAADHIEVLDQALAQLPVWDGEGPIDGTEIVARTDTAGCSHDFVDGCRRRRVRFSVGMPLTVDIAKIVVTVPESDWIPAVSADGTKERDHSEVCEVTGLLNLSRWPQGTRAIARREDPHPGAQFTFTDHDGHRYQLLLTDQTDPDIAFLEARHRGRARVEQRIAAAKDSGLRNLPFTSFAANQAWLTLVLLCQDLIAWTQTLLLEGDLRRAEPKRLRFTLWHQAGTLAHTGRRTYLRLGATWPWAQQLARAFNRLQTLPLTA